MQANKEKLNQIKIKIFEYYFEIRKKLKILDLIRFTILYFQVLSILNFL